MKKRDASIKILPDGNHVKGLERLDAPRSTKKYICALGKKLT